MSQAAPSHEAAACVVLQHGVSHVALLRVLRMEPRGSHQDTSKRRCLHAPVLRMRASSKQMSWHPAEVAAAGCWVLLRPQARPAHLPGPNKQDWWRACLMQVLHVCTRLPPTRP